MPAVTHVATLIGQSAVLSERHVAAVRAVLPGAEPPRWLAEGIAADVAFAPEPGSGNPRWSEAARRALGGSAIDVVVQPQAHRRKRLLVADMDSTIIAQECIDELARLAGHGEAVSALTRRSVRGEVDFDESLRRRVALLAGIGQAELDGLAARLTPNPGAATLVATMRANGAMAVLASGGFDCFTTVVAARIGFDRHHGNALELAAGRLTGRLREPILGCAAKAEILRALRDELRLVPEDTMAVGDGANDLAMLSEAGLGVAYRAAPAVAAVARARIDHSDLAALLYFQGYTRAEFIEVAP